MNRAQGGFTLVELIVVLAVIALITTFLIPVIQEPIRHARIEGGIEQAKGILASCDLVRVKPVSSVRSADGLTVTHSYRTGYATWTDATVLRTLVDPAHSVVTVNPFGFPYYFRMSSSECLVALEIDEVIDGWVGLPTEVVNGRTRIIVGSNSRKPMVNPDWVHHQKRILNGAAFR